MKVGLAALAMMALAGSAAGAAEEDATTVGDFCRTELSMPASVCDCVMRKFGKLSEDQQAFLGAILREEADKLPALVNALTAEEQTQAQTFITREIMLCKPSG